MKKSLLAVCILAFSSYAMATGSYMKCTGVDSAGNSVYLTADSNSSIVNINGDALQIVGKTRNGQGVVTQKFISVYGTLVYDSLVPVTNTNLNIYQFNAVTEALLAQAWLTCQFGDTASSKLIDLPIFSSIKARTFGLTDGMPFNKAKQQDNVESSLSGNPDPSCIAKVDAAINVAKNHAAAQGMLCTPADIENRMKIAMSKGYCYGQIDNVKTCQIKLDAMISSGKGCNTSDAALRETAKKISGC